MSLGVLDFFVYIVLDWSKSNSIVGVVSNHGGIGLKRLGVLFSFIMFIAGILVCIRKPKDDIALALLRYRDDSGWKTVLWVGFSVLDSSYQAQTTRTRVTRWWQTLTRDNFVVICCIHKIWIMTIHIVWIQQITTSQN